LHEFLPEINAGGRQREFLATRQSAQSRSVTAQRLAFARLHVPFEAPAIDHLGVETPVSTDPESGQLATAQELVNGRWVNPKVGRQLPHRHHAGQIVLWFCHDSLSPLLQANPLAPTSAQIDAFLCLTETDCYLKPALTTSNVPKNANAGQEVDLPLSTAPYTALWTRSLGSSLSFQRLVNLYFENSIFSTYTVRK
jgi:hypothetical protein